MTSASIHVLTGPERSIALVVGGSRGIGAEIVQLLAKGHPTLLTYHRHAARAERVAQDVNAVLGNPLRCSTMPLNLADPDSRTALVQQFIEAGVTISRLVLSASGGLERGVDPGYAMQLNAEGPAALLDALLPLLRPGAIVAYLTSHEAHFYDPEMVYPPYRQVAESKKAGELALLERAHQMAAVSVTLNIVSADLVADSTTAKLLDMGGHGIVAFRRQMAGTLPSSRDVAEEVYRLCEFERAAHCSVSFVGVPDAFYADRGSGMLQFDWSQALEQRDQLKAQERIRLPLPANLPRLDQPDAMIGIDIGGTKTAIARLSDKGITVTRVPTPAGLDAGGIAGWLDQVLGELPQGARVTVSVPGIVRGGRVVACDVVPGLAGWRGGQADLDIALTNDAVASLVGARVLAATEGPCLLIAAGTGLGGAFTVDGSHAGVLTLEPGYTPVTVLNDAIPRRLDDVASGRAICAELNCNLSDLQKLLVKGDLAAVALCRKAGTMLGRAIGGWINLLAAPRVLVVGGLADAAPYWEGVQLGVGLTQMPELAATCLAQRVEYGAHAGVLGALAMAAESSDAHLAQGFHAKHLRIVGHG